MDRLIYLSMSAAKATMHRQEESRVLPGLAIQAQSPCSALLQPGDTPQQSGFA